MSDLPIVCVPANRVEFEGASVHAVKQQYTHALTEIVKCVPLMIPAIGKDFDLKSIASKIGGILLTGSPSHVNPSCYGAERDFEPEALDLDRDETNLPLIREAIALDIPMFAVCRGFQELNVVCGGTLHQYVHNLPGMLDHRKPKDAPVSKMYQIQQHNILTQKGGLFERLKLPQKFMVNSLHQQGIDKLGKGLFVEGKSEDGLIEAVSMPGKRFIFGTQFHPEGDFWLNPVSRILFEEFGRVLHKK
jgi:putative glutamine amidotransferase